jgi:flagellin
MRELAVQSSNGIYSNSDRATLNAESKQLVAELDRISKSTSFNGQNLLDGKLGNIKLQVGAEANQTISFKIAATDAKSLGMGSTTADMAGAENSLVADTTALKQNDILINGQSILGAGQTWTGNTDDLDELVNHINENVSHTADEAGDGVLAAGETFKVDITKLDGTVSSVEVTDTTSMQELADKLNDQSNGLLTASITSDGKLNLSSSAGTLDITDGGAATNGAGGFGASASYEAKLVLTSEDGKPVTVSRGSTGTLEQLNQFGFRENNKSGVIEGQSIADPTQAWGVGDLTINGVAISATDTDSLQGKVDAINKASTDTGVTAKAFSSAQLDFSATQVTTIVGGDFDLNGVTVTMGGTPTSLQDLADDLNGFTDKTGITATVSGNRILLEGNVTAITFSDGSAGGVQAAFTDGNGGITTFATGGDESAAADIDDQSQALGGLKLESNSGAPISVKLGANATIADIGLSDANSVGENGSGSSISSVSIATQDGAQKAIKIIDNALTTINDTRASLGAVNNRLDFTVSNLSSISEKTTAARSRIIDADFASETANLSRATVLQQAATAMLAQANQRPQNVLSLLR